MSITKELEKKISEDMEEVWRSNFERKSRYLNNGIYSWMNLHSTDCRELFLMGIASMEDIDYKGKGE